MSDNMTHWKLLSHPPKEALKSIKGGRLSGKTDINPQWRYKAMTEQFGKCGVGWKFTVEEIWSVDGPEGEKFAFAKIHLFISCGDGDQWSAPIPGIGGSMLIAKEKAGLHANDEAFKMAVTDALGTAMKMIGVASSIYEGLWDGSKYVDQPVPEKKAQPKPKQQEQAKEPDEGPDPEGKFLEPMQEPPDGHGEFDSNGPPEGPVSDDNIVTIKGINVKTGESAKGPWKKTSFVCVEAENWYSTFSKTHGKLIQDAGKGAKLVVEYEEDQYGRTITDIAVLETK